MKLYALITVVTFACMLWLSELCAAAFPLGTRQQQVVTKPRNVSGSFLALYSVPDTVMPEVRHFRGDETHAQEPEQKGGGFGSAALICGVLGIWPAAIILGIIGLSKGRPNRNLSRAGLILGIVVAAFFLLALTILLL